MSLKRVFSRLLQVICILVCFSFSTSLSANWKAEGYSHFSKNEPFISLLKDFSAALGVPIVVSPQLKDAELPEFSGELNGSGLRVIEKISRIYNLAWYYDNHMLYLYASDENKTLLLTLSNITPSLAKQSLEQSGVYESRFSWQPMQGAKSVLLSGPPRYVELVQQVVTAYDASSSNTEENAHVVKVFQLKHAWAKDRIVQSRGQKRIIPGVATSVQRILSRQQNPHHVVESDVMAPDAWKYGGAGFEEAANGATGVALMGEGLAGKGNGSKDALEDNLPGNANTRVITTPRSSSSYVEASPQHNAVIVYDLKTRMPLYDSLIKALDMPSDQVEIEVSIIDVKTNRLNELGIAWQANGSDAKGGFGEAAQVFNETQGANVLFGDRVNLSTIMAGQVDYFLGKVNALARDGDGQILSQPTVLTIDNQEALIDNSSTFFVRLQGQEEVDLVPITTGSILRVTPRIMDNQSRISLSVDISDGERTDASEVDNIPSISTSHINTQAVVSASSSLLVGGYYYDQQASSEDKIPILGDIPGLKLLFSNSRKSRVKVARLFLITPRVIANDTSNTLVARSSRLRDMVEREKSFYDTQYKEPKLSIFD